MNKWIDVKDRLPDEGQTVLTFPYYVVCMFGIDGERSGFAGKFSNYISGIGDVETLPHPRFWMPLPDPPKTVNTDKA